MSDAFRFGEPVSRRAFVKGVAALGSVPFLVSPSVSGEMTPIKPDDPYLPRGYNLTAYVNCGPSTKASGETGVAIKQLNGSAYTFPNVEGPLGNVAFDETQVEYEISGLKDNTEYVLGFTWWDVDGAGRWQSVRFGTGEPATWTTVLGPASAVAFYEDKPTWARGLLPIPGESVKDGRLLAAFAKDKGPNAVVNELFLLEKPRNEERKRVLLVTGDDYPGHRWRETAPVLAAILREDSRQEVSVVDIPAVLGSPLLAHYDAVVLHFKNYAERLPLGKEVGLGLERFAHSGKGVVLSHFACGAFQEWDGFVKVAGRVWNPELRGHDPRGEFLVEVADDSHPITSGRTAFRTTDELYTCLDGDVPIHVLYHATSKVDQKVYPIAFVVEMNKGRVFHCTLGHDVEAFQAEGVQALFRRATAWAAGMPPM